MIAWSAHSGIRNDIWCCGVIIYTILKDGKAPWLEPDGDNDKFSFFAQEHKYNLVSYAEAVYNRRCLSAMEREIIKAAGSALAKDPMQRPSIRDMVNDFKDAIGLTTDLDGGSGQRQKNGSEERGDQAMTEGQLPLGEPLEASEGRPLSRTPPSAPRPALGFDSDSPQSSQPLPTPQQPLSPLRPPSRSESDSDSDSCPGSDSRSSPSFPRASLSSHSADQDILTPSSGPDDAPPQHSSPSASHESSTTGEQLESPTVNQSLPLEPVGRSHAKPARTEEQVLSEWKKMNKRLFENVPPGLKTKAGERVSSGYMKGMKGMEELLAGTVYCYDSHEASSASDSLLRAPLTLTEEKQLEDVAGKGALIFKKIDRGSTQSSVPEVVIHAWLSQHARQEVSRLALKLYGVVSTEGTEGGEQWSVSEFISPGSLGEGVARDMLRLMSLAEKANLCLQLLHHVKELHSLGIAHGDLSLANLLLRRQGNGYELLLNDFETAERYHITYSTAQRGKDQNGTGDFVNQHGSKDLIWSPFRNDIWACGVLIYTILKDRNEPWDMPDAETSVNFKIFAHMNQYSLVSYAGAVSEMETKVLDVAGSALAKDPMQRPSMEEMVEKFKQAIGLPADVDGGSGGRQKEGSKERGDQVMTGQLPLGEPPEASEGRPPSRTPPSAPRPSVGFGSDSPQSSQPLPTAQQPLSPRQPPSPSESRAMQPAHETPPDGPDGAPRQPSPLRARLCRVREVTGSEGFLQSTASSRLKEVQRQPLLPPARLRRLRWVTGNESFLVHGQLKTEGSSATCAGLRGRDCALW
ncbi:unnamed protein product [Vitrella brassicaformis CCMP3155]|uniref:non-specific serine/threonine protein kinase n=1 Tax=Vitrella brassicaformis (strain CCMP3155) TaxID=1169540 RepID=A0A0G4EQU9_VITBC|nr:unnamed protein product [Vitrella brassicaformis CCMP3155]|eukprot:CEM00613.1 unnamed protein product [Vitrella brassicaformis CCMP3155]